MKVDDMPWDLLSAVRQNFGADDGEDKSYDKEIEKLEIIDLIGRYSEWHLGDANWGQKFVEAYRLLNDANCEVGE